jgi:GAF domain-containing protein
MIDVLDHETSRAERATHYELTIQRILSLIEGEDDWVSAMATVACELHHAFAYFHWTGFYRHVAWEELAVGPYQGGHGCLRISFARGVCGAAARTRTTQRVDDVRAFPDHIACSSTTLSELVVPVLVGDQVLAVLDVDSDLPAVFHETDQRYLERLAATLGERFAHVPIPAPPSLAESMTAAKASPEKPG